MSNSVDLVIKLKTVRMTTADNVQSMNGINFVMEGDDVTVELEPTSCSFVSKLTSGANAGAIQILTGGTSSTDDFDGNLTINFTCQDAGGVGGGAADIYLINGFAFKRNIPANPSTGTPASTQMPRRFSSMRGMGTFSASIDYDCGVAGLDYEFYLLIQNATNGAIGLVDPKIVTRA